MVPTVVTSTTVAVAASLGDFGVAAAAVNLRDVAGRRRRRPVVALGVSGEVVGACGWFGWMTPGPVGAWEGDGYANELGGCGSERHGNVPNKKPQTNYIWPPFGLNHSVMGKTRGGWVQDVKRCGCVRDRLNHCGNRRRARWRGRGRRRCVWVQRYRKWSSTSGTINAGRAGRIGCCRCGVILSGSRRGTCHMVGIPSYKFLLPAGTE